MPCYTCHMWHIITVATVRLLVRNKKFFPAPVTSGFLTSALTAKCKILVYITKLMQTPQYY